METYEGVEGPEKIPLTQIQAMSNIRTEIGDFTELKESIRQHGLLQPVGLWKRKDGRYSLVWGNRRMTALKLLNYSYVRVGKEAVLIDDKEMDEEKYLILNTIENTQRKDITPVELGALCVKLMGEPFNLSQTEIAFKLDMTEAKISVAIGLFRGVPQKYRGKVGYIHGNSSKEGMVAAETMRRIMQVRTSKANREFLIKKAIAGELRSEECRLISGMLERGMSVKEAIKEKENYRIVMLSTVVEKSICEDLEKRNKMSIGKILPLILAGKLPVAKRLIYNKGE